MTTANAFDGYLCTITFRDAARTDTTGPPVHVTSSVLLDGQPSTIQVTDWSIDGQLHDATTVTVRVRAEDCELDQDAKFASVGGIPVLCPPLEDRPWLDFGDYVDAVFFVRQAYVTGTETQP
jgi:hypothetical protein